MNRLLPLSYVKLHCRDFYFILFNKFYRKYNKFKYNKFKYNKFKYNKFKYNKFKYNKFKYNKFKYNKFNLYLLNMFDLVKLKKFDLDVFFRNVKFIYMQFFTKFFAFKKKMFSDLSLTLLKVLLFNFKRKRFFPSLLNYQKETYVFFSLGMISNRYGRGKNFIKKKITFFNTTAYVRKILIYTFLTQVILFIKRTPIYLMELFNVLLRPVVTLYSNPFNYASTIEEKLYRNKFYFNRVIFSNNKAYGFMKSKQKGHLKRKIQSKVILKNRILD